MVVNNEASSSEQPKAKPTKAERRVLQESQRVAKAAAKGSNSNLSLLLNVGSDICYHVA